MGTYILNFFQSICRFNFGTFEKEEFKKFLRLGLIFSLIIGIYWTLRIIKDAIFIDIVGKYYLPYAKTFSVLFLLPLVMFYTKLLEKTSRERMLVILPTIYGLCIFAFAIFLPFALGTQEEINARSTIPYIATKGFAYLWYFFVESFGSLLVALFWAFSTDSTAPNSAKRGFPLVVAIGQMGGIILPISVGGLPYRLGLETDLITLFILGGVTLMIIPLFRYFLRSTPKDLLKAFHGKNEEKEEEKQEPGFLEGLKLLLQHKYLIGIFAANFIYEVIITIFDFNFKVAASTAYSGVALSNYLGIYSSSVNTVSLLCLLFGISNVTRYLGVGVALASMPIIVAGALFGFLTIDSLSFLFMLMVGSKAVNYSLNGPALKQLYIPTTHDVRFKAQAWIETFGSRASKQAGSVFNMILKPLESTFGALAGRSYYLFLSGGIGFPLLAIWFATALYLGRTFKKAIDDKNMIC